MEIRSYYILFFITIFSLGCTVEAPVSNNEIDDHGCDESKSLAWCEETQKCYNVWEEECNIEEPSDENAEIKDNEKNEDEIIEPEDYSNEPEQDVIENKYDEIDNQIQIEKEAKEFILTLSDYKDYNGRELEVNKVIKNECDGCWKVEVKFLSDSEHDSKIEDEVRVLITFEDNKIIDAVVAKGGSKIYSVEKCESENARVVNIIEEGQCGDDEETLAIIEGLQMPHICCK